MADKHFYAYRVVAYACVRCNKEEMIWNSRDGEIPYSINCSQKNCSGIMSNTGRVVGPKRKVSTATSPHTRYFVDMTFERAQQLAEVEALRIIKINPERAPEEEALIEKLTRSFFGNGNQADLVKRIK